MVVSSPTRPYEEQGNVPYDAAQKDMGKIAFKCITSHFELLEYLTHARTHLRDNINFSLFFSEKFMSTRND